jgi:hypothetical protein
MCANQVAACMNDAGCGAQLMPFLQCVCAAQAGTMNQKAGQTTCVNNFSAVGAIEKALTDCVSAKCATQCLVQ